MCTSLAIFNWKQLVIQQKQGYDLIHKVSANVSTGFIMTACAHLLLMCTNVFWIFMHQLQMVGCAALARIYLYSSVFCWTLKMHLCAGAHRHFIFSHTFWTVSHRVKLVVCIDSARSRKGFHQILYSCIRTCSNIFSGISCERLVKWKQGYVWIHNVSAEVFTRFNCMRSCV